MKTFHFLSVALLFGGILGLPTARATVTLGQIDNFQDGTTDNWGTGAVSPVNVSGGGPAGADDNFLELTADGSGANGKLTIFNRTQWLGDYIGQGIGEIDMDLENLGSITLNIRIAFRSSTSGGGAPGYLSAAVSLPPDDTWHHEIFQVTPATMIAVGSPDAFGTFFANEVAEFRIINEAGTANLTGDTVTSQMGADNIQAVPEPSSLGMLLLSLLGLSCLGSRRVSCARRVNRGPTSRPHIA